MPRPNKPRTVGAEDALALRIAREREARGWTYQALADAMTEVGCPTNVTATYRIEKGQPRRRITVNELAALSIVWAIPVNKLLEE